MAKKVYIPEMGDKVFMMVDGISIPLGEATVAEDASPKIKSDDLVMFVSDVEGDFMDGFTIFYKNIKWLYGDPALKFLNNISPQVHKDANSVDGFWLLRLHIVDQT